MLVCLIQTRYWQNILNLFISEVNYFTTNENLLIAKQKALAKSFDFLCPINSSAASFALEAGWRWNRWAGISTVSLECDVEIRCKSEQLIKCQSCV